MKKILLGILLGFTLHKATEEVFDYHFRKGFVACGPQYAIDTKNNVDAPLTKRFKCTREQMGYVVLLEYLLIRPHWSDPGKDRWYY